MALADIKGNKVSLEFASRATVMPGGIYSSHVGFHKKLGAQDMAGAN